MGGVSRPSAKTCSSPDTSGEQSGMNPDRRHSLPQPNVEKRPNSRSLSCVNRDLTPPIASPPTSQGQRKRKEQMYPSALKYEDANQDPYLQLQLGMAPAHCAQSLSVMQLNCRFLPRFCRLRTRRSPPHTLRR